MQHNVVMQQSKKKDRDILAANVSQPDIDVSRIKRFAAMMYEGVLLFAVVFLAAYVFDILTESRHGLLNREARIVVLFVAIGVYFLVCWQRGGQTLPMRAWHIKLVSASGAKPAFKQLLIRYLLMWPLPLAGMAAIYGLVTLTGWPAILLFAIVAPFLVFLTTFGSDTQFLHDRWAKTRLVDIRSQSKDAAKQ